MASAFRVIKRKLIFSKGPIRLLDCDIRMPGGRKLSRQVLGRTDAVVILPRIEKDRFILIRQFRFATGRWIWEFPAGGVDRGESLAAAARRELIEEVSRRPCKLTKLISYYPTPGVSGEVMHLYLAEKLVPATAEKDEDEELEVHEFRLREIGAMIRRGAIIDGKTVLGFYYLKERFGIA